MPTHTEPTEWTYAAELASWMNEIIADFRGPLTRAVCEERVRRTGRRPDVLIYAEANEIVLTILVKRPDMELSIFGDELRAEACGKARSVGARYAATHDVNQFVLWDADTEQRVDDFTVTLVAELQRYRTKEQEIKNSMQGILAYFVDLRRGRRQPRPLDQTVPEALARLVEGFIIEGGITEYLVRHFHDDSTFRTEFDNWVLDAGRAEPENDTELREQCTRLARQFLYTFVNKAMFYYVLRDQYPALARLTLPADGHHIVFNQVFNVFLREAERESGDYETVFQTDFVDAIPIPTAALEHLCRIAHYIDSLEYAEVPYDLIGRIFERLVAETERHYMGQFFTPAPVVDLILGFCQRDPDAMGLDPGCGSGTFLVRMYYRFRYLDSGQSHEQLLNKSWGIDIARFPAHLSTINLAIRDLSSHENYPMVIAKDFFDVEGSGSSVTIGLPQRAMSLGFEQPTEQLSAEAISREVPPMNFVVGNPPYTRHEELHEEVFGEDYKAKLNDVIKRDFPGLDLAQQAGIYAYFIPHGLRFLESDGDRLGYVTLSSWMDANYGRELKEFLLNSTKLVAVIESRVERWFEETQMLPLVLILERASSPESVADHEVKFVRLTKALGDLLPVPEHPDETAQLRHWQKVDDLTAAIETAHQRDGEGFPVAAPTGTRENAELKYVDSDGWEALCVPQSYLDGNEKWGKYLRAPKAYFRAFTTSHDLIVPLAENDNSPAYLARGVTTGANEFFCLRNARNPFDVQRRDSEYVLTDPSGAERFRLPEEFVYPGVTKMKPYRSISIAEAEDLIFSCPLSAEELERRFPGVLAYVEWGEARGYHQRPTCAGREPWYDLGVGDTADMIFPTLTWSSYRVHFNEINAVATNCHGELRARDRPTPLCALLNSTFAALCAEFCGLYIENRDQTISNQLRMSDIRSIPVIDPRRLDETTAADLNATLDSLRSRDVLPAWDEVTQEDRRRLDDIVFRRILGLSVSEANELREAYVNAVEYRIKRS